MSYARAEILQHAKRIGKSRATLRRWISQGCNLRDPKSVSEWVTRNEVRKTNVQRSRERRSEEQRKAERVAPARTAAPGQTTSASEHPAGSTVTVDGNGEAPAAGRKGAAAALERLEAAEESAHRRLEAALESGDRFRIQDAQDFWLKCSETLRRLDLAVEVARRQEETQVPLKVAEAAVLAAAEWMRVAVTTFLSSETISLMGIKDPGEFRYYFGQRFVGNLHLVIKGADKTQSAIPDWAKTAIATAWNVRIDP